MQISGKAKDLSKVKEVDEGELEEIIKELNLKSGEKGEIKGIDVSEVKNVKDAKLVAVDMEDMNKILVDQKIITQEEADKLKATEDKLSKLYEGTEKFFDDGKIDKNEEKKLAELDKKANALIDENKEIENKIAKNFKETGIDVSEKVEGTQIGDVNDGNVKDGKLIEIDGK